MSDGTTPEASSTPLPQRSEHRHPALPGKSSIMAHGDRTLHVVVSCRGRRLCGSVAGSAWSSGWRSCSLPESSASSRYSKPRRYPLTTTPARARQTPRLMSAACWPSTALSPRLPNFPGGGRVSADYALDVHTASRTLHLTFSADSPLLRYAVDGDRAVVTMWRGVPVSVVTDGRSEVTASVPVTGLARDLGNSEKTGGVGAFFVFIALANRGNRRAGGTRPLTRPVRAAALLALVLGGIVVVIGGIALGGQPSRLGPDLAATGAALVVVLGLSAWLGIIVRRQASHSPASLAARKASRTVGTTCTRRSCPRPDSRERPGHRCGRACTRRTGLVCCATPPPGCF